MPALELVCLGTGKGSTAVYHGNPSSSFALLCDGIPLLLVEAGPGAVRSCLQHCGSLPGVLYISHNHTDAAGELPLILPVETGQGRSLRVVAETGVMRRLLDHRLAEFHELMEVDNRRLSDLATFVNAPEGQLTPVTDELAIITHRSRHSERCFGFVLFYRSSPVLGYTGDSGFDRRYYARVGISPVLVVSARNTGSADHASFADVAEFQRLLQQNRETLPTTKIFVTGYGNAEDCPTSPEPLREGSRVVIHSGVGAPSVPTQGSLIANTAQHGHGAITLEHLQLTPITEQLRLSTARAPGPQLRYGSPSPRSTASPRQRPGAKTPPARVSQRPAGSVPRHITVFDNEDKGRPGKTFILNATIRTLAQLKLKVSEALNIKPIKHLYTTNGAVVETLEELFHGQELVATRCAGVPFVRTNLPLQMLSR